MSFFSAFCGCQERTAGSLDRQDVADADVPVNKIDSSAEKETLANDATPRTSDHFSKKVSYKSQDEDESSGGKEAWRSEGQQSNVSMSKFASGGSMWSVMSADAEGGPLVSIDDEFDFYEPYTKLSRVVKMADVHHDVLHERVSSRFPNIRRFFRGDRKKPQEEAKAKDANSPDPSDGSQSGTSESSESEASDSGAPAGDKSAGSMLKRQQSYFDADNVTNWGILIGKLIRRRVLGISGIALSRIHKTRVTTRMTVDSPAQYILPSVLDRAQLIRDQAKALAKWVAQEKTDRFDAEWQELDTMTYLFGKDYVDTLMLLANTVRKVFAAQPVLAEATVPARVFGDIHGQLRDFLILLRAFGMPRDSGGPSFIFNGDFVDRGSHSLEVVGLLFALKICDPERVWLVRGNHEDRAMNEKYGFEEECLAVLGRGFGAKTYDVIHNAFAELPIACLIAEKILVVHGGIGEGKFTLNDIRAVQRPLWERHLAADPMIWNMLWSDPIEDDHAAEQLGVFGVHASPRSSTGLYKFGWNVTKTFCATNGLGLIIRSHQSKEGSLGFSVMHDKMLVRVFSARDYEGHGNDGAVVLVTLKDPAKPRGELVVRPQVMRSCTKLLEGDKPRSSRKKKTKNLLGGLIKQPQQKAQPSDQL